LNVLRLNSINFLVPMLRRLKKRVVRLVVRYGCDIIMAKLWYLPIHPKKLQKPLLK